MKQDLITQEDEGHKKRLHDTSPKPTVELQAVNPTPVKAKQGSGHKRLNDATPQPTLEMEAVSPSPVKAKRRKKKKGLLRRLCCCWKIAVGKTHHREAFVHTIDTGCESELKSKTEPMSKKLSGRHSQRYEQNLAPAPQYQPSYPLVPASQMHRYLLGPAGPKLGKKTLVLDLDETLVHSSFEPLKQADFVLPVEIDATLHNIYVLKRPGLDYFLRRIAPKFELVVFTASHKKYANPLLDVLDPGPQTLLDWRLFRDDCTQHGEAYVKDLSRLGRALQSTIIIDNSPASYLFHPQNALPIGSWFDDTGDRELYDMIPVLEALVQVDDVCSALAR